jgi:hypothetical protein
MIRLKQWQGLKIGSESYVVTGCISYRNGSDTWDEYTLRNASGAEAWFSVDNNDGEYVLSHTATSPLPANYKVVDQGIATVTSRFGNTDVDIGERVRFTEYEDEFGFNTYSIEQWEDETEYSQGRHVEEIEIQILDKPPFDYRKYTGETTVGSIILCIITSVFFVLIPLLAFLPDSCTSSCKSCSPSDPNYTKCQAEYNSCMRARSIRQQSRRTRSFSGGGTSHGK